RSGDRSGFESRRIPAAQGVGSADIQMPRRGRADMNCELFRDLIVKQVSGGAGVAVSANPSEADALRAHLSNCESCRHYQTEIAATWTELDALAESSVGTTSVGEIMNRIETAARKSKA